MRDAYRRAYARFKVGLTFADVRAELMQEQRAARRAGQYMFVSRGTVLGRMHQHKRTAFEYALQAGEIEVPHA